MQSLDTLRIIASHPVLKKKKCQPLCELLLIIIKFILFIMFLKKTSNYRNCQEHSIDVSQRLCI